MNGFALVAMLLCCTGLGALRISWRRSGLLARFTMTVGWMLLSAATYMSVQAWGVEFGISYALSGFTLIALPLVLVNMKRRPAAADKGHSTPELATGTRRKCLTLLTAGPLAGLASGQLTLVVTRALPGSEVNNMATAALAFPILWGLMAYATCLTHTPKKPAMMFFAVAATFSIALYS